MNIIRHRYGRRDFLTRNSAALASLLFTSLAGCNFPSSPNKEKRLVQTLTGLLDPAGLGATLMHEHILWFGGPGQGDINYEPIPDSLVAESVNFAASALNHAYGVGLRTLVDLTPHRPIDLYKKIAAQTKVNIIASTGFYRRSKIPKWVSDINDEAEMEEKMFKEITEGIDGTDIKAGIIKVASEDRSKWEQKVFRAAARVNKRTGVPIATHAATDTLWQFDLLMANGADPSKILFSHVDLGRKGQPGELLNVTRQGCYLEVDTFGQEFYTPQQELMTFLRNLCNDGFSSKVIISIDSNWHWENGQKMFEGSGPPNFDVNASKRLPSYMFTDVVPLLLKKGFNANEINTFLVENPAAYFS